MTRIIALADKANGGNTLASAVSASDQRERGNLTGRDAASHCFETRNKRRDS